MDAQRKAASQYDASFALPECAELFGSYGEAEFPNGRIQLCFLLPELRIKRRERKARPGYLILGGSVSLPPRNGVDGGKSHINRCSKQGSDGNTSADGSGIQFFSHEKVPAPEHECVS